MTAEQLSLICHLTSDDIKNHFTQLSRMKSNDRALHILIQRMYRYPHPPIKRKKVSHLPPSTEFWLSNFCNGLVALHNWEYEIPLRPSLSPSPYAVSWRETSSRVNTQLTPLCDGMKPVTFGTPFLSTHAWKYKSRLVCVRAYVCVHACIACRGTRARACMCVQSREVQKEEQLDDLPPKGHRQSDEH